MGWKLCDVLDRLPGWHNGFLWNDDSPLQTALGGAEAWAPEARDLVLATLRARPIDAFFSVALPLALPGYIGAAVLTFAHTIGEFGIVLMIGGNIPGKTRVLSTEIYGHVEAMNYVEAHWLAGGMVVFAFLVLLAMTRLQRDAHQVMQ